MKRIFFSLLVVLAGMFGYAWWHYPDLLFRQVNTVRVEPPAQPPTAQVPADPAVGVPASPASQEQLAQRPVEEVHESADSETTLESILPRQSIGHAQGLDKVKDALKLSASVALVMDAQRKAILHAKNPDAVLPIASITKLMTAMVVLDAKLAMDESITITEDDVDKERMSRSRMRVGYVLPRSEALHLALMSSENRASHALARTFPAGMEAFIKAMNHKAKQLGMTQTVFRDPTGLSTANQSTAWDLATLVLAASAYPVIRDYSTSLERYVTVGNRTLRYRNSDPLVKDPSWNIALQKTGYIVEAGHCVVLRTTMGGRDLVVVVLDASSNGRRSADARRIQDWIAPGEAAAARESARKPAPKTAAKKAEPKRATTARVKKSFPSRPVADKSKRDEKS